MVWIHDFGELIPPWIDAKIEDSSQCEICGRFRDVTESKWTNGAYQLSVCEDCFYDQVLPFGKSLINEVMLLG